MTTWLECLQVSTSWLNDCALAHTSDDTTVTYFILQTICQIIMHMYSVPDSTAFK